MTKWIVLVSTTVGSAVGWWIGARFGMMTGYVLSVVGLAAGVWYGRRLAERLVS
jgi:uncharacterized protein YcfJ